MIMARNLTGETLIEHTAHRSGVSPKIVKVVLSAAFDVIGETLVDRGKVAITNLGTWYASEVAPRAYRDPSTGEEWMSRRTYLPRFRPAPKLTEVVKSGKFSTLKKRGH
jgi:nucleoid DNA-binding protein